MVDARQNKYSTYPIFLSIAPPIILSVTTIFFVMYSWTLAHPPVVLVCLSYALHLLLFCQFEPSSYTVQPPKSCMQYLDAVPCIRPYYPYLSFHVLTPRFLIQISAHECRLYVMRLRIYVYHHLPLVLPENTSRAVNVRRFFCIRERSTVDSSVISTEYGKARTLSLGERSGVDIKNRLTSPSRSRRI